MFCGWAPFMFLHRLKVMQMHCTRYVLAIYTALGVDPVGYINMIRHK